MTNNFFDDIEPPKTPKRLPKTIKTNEIMMLFNVCDRTKALGNRNYCILELLYGCGLRVSELCNLNCEYCFLHKNEAYKLYN